MITAATMAMAARYSSAPILWRHCLEATKYHDQATSEAAETLPIAMSGADHQGSGRPVVALAAPL
jgi:hypothetical protein